MAAPNAQQQHQDYFRSVSSESTTYMMVPAGGASGTRRKEAPSKMWVAMVVIVVVVLQIASTTGLFVYLNMSISEVRPDLPVRLHYTRFVSLLQGKLFPLVLSCLFFKHRRNSLLCTELTRNTSMGLNFKVEFYFVLFAGVKLSYIYSI